METKSFTKEEILIVLHDMYKHTSHKDAPHFQQHHKAEWILPFIFSDSEKFHHMAAIESMFKQGLSILRLLAEGIDVHEFDEKVELIMTVFALSTPLRDSVHVFGEKVLSVEPMFRGLGSVLTISSGGHRQLRHRYDDEELDACHDILVGGVNVTGNTLLAFADAFEEFVRKE